jgi:TRAP-type C4-dicarboxylate transport system substrate-binding protein
VKTPADLAGVKLRMPPGAGWTALGRGLGVTPTPMAMPEVYLAMKSGAIDGQENPLALARYNNLQEVSQQFVLTSHLVQPVAFAIAKPVWDKLTPAQQEVMRKHARTAADFNDKGRLQDEKEMVAFFEKAGLKVTTPDLAAFKASVDKQYAEAGLSQKWQAGLAERIVNTK